MRLRLQTETNAESARVSQLLRFSLARVSPEIADVRVSTGSTRDAFGARLTHCSAEVRTHYGERVRVDETQASLELAVTRAIARCIGTLQRRLGKEGQLRSA